MMNRLSKWIAAAALVATALGWAATAAAQSAVDYSELKSRIERIEKELRTLQRAAARGRVVAATEGEGTSGLAPAQGHLLADMEVRMSQLETELRQLTGQVEELIHRQGRLEREFQRFREDVEFRFQDEGGPLPPAEGENEAGGGPPPGLVPTETPAEQEEILEEERMVPALPQGTVTEQYDYAFSFLRKGDYQSAQHAFEAFLAAHPDHALAGNAQYWLGESYYVRQMYPQAAAAFLKGFQQYGDSAKGPDNLLKLGMTLAAMGQTGEACSAFAELDSRYPNAPETIRQRVAEESGRLNCG